MRQRDRQAMGLFAWWKDCHSDSPKWQHFVGRMAEGGSTAGADTLAGCMCVLSQAEVPHLWDAEQVLLHRALWNCWKPPRNIKLIKLVLSPLCYLDSLWKSQDATRSFSNYLSAAPDPLPVISDVRQLDCFRIGTEQRRYLKAQGKWMQSSRLDPADCLHARSGPTARWWEAASVCLPALSSASPLRADGSHKLLRAQRQQEVRKAKHNLSSPSRDVQRGFSPPASNTQLCRDGRIFFSCLCRDARKIGVFFSFHFPLLNLQFLETFSTFGKWWSWEREENLSQCHFNKWETFVKLRSRKGREEEQKSHLIFLVEQKRKKKKAPNQYCICQKCVLSKQVAEWKEDKNKWIQPKFFKWETTPNSCFLTHPFLSAPKLPVQLAARAPPPLPMPQYREGGKPGPALNTELCWSQVYLQVKSRTLTAQVGIIPVLNREQMVTFPYGVRETHLWMNYC